MILRIRVAWINKATRANARARAPSHTQKYVILFAFPRQQCYVMRTLPVLFNFRAGGM
jgi:hypothetical protein